MVIIIESGGVSHELIGTFDIYGTSEELMLLNIAIEEQAPLIHGTDVGVVNINIYSIVMQIRQGETIFEVTGEVKIYGKRLTLLNIAEQIEYTAVHLEQGWVKLGLFIEPVSQETIDSEVIKEIKLNQFLQKVSEYTGIPY